MWLQCSKKHDATVWTDSRQSGQTPDRLDRLQTVWTDSKQFGQTPDSLDRLKTVWTDSRQTGQTPDSLDRLQTVLTDSRQTGQTPDKEIEIENLTFHVSGYTENDTTGMLSPPTWSVTKIILRCTVSKT